MRLFCMSILLFQPLLNPHWYLSQCFGCSWFLRSWIQLTRFRLVIFQNTWQWKISWKLLNSCCVFLTSTISFSIVQSLCKISTRSSAFFSIILPISCKMEKSVLSHMLTTSRRPTIIISGPLCLLTFSPIRNKRFDFEVHNEQCIHKTIKVLQFENTRNTED